VDNIMLTFGGSWNEGDRNEVSNWAKTPGLGAFNVDPQIIPLEMWQAVSSRTCVETDNQPPPTVGNCVVNSDW